MEDVNLDKKQDMTKAFSSKPIIYSLWQIMSEQVPVADSTTTPQSYIAIEVGDYEMKDSVAVARQPHARRAQRSVSAPHAG